MVEAKIDPKNFTKKWRTFLEMPRWWAIWRETQGTLSQFFTNAIPIFLAIKAIASVLDWFGLIA